MHNSMKATFSGTQSFIQDRVAVELRFLSFVDGHRIYIHVTLVIFTSDPLSLVDGLNSIYSVKCFQGEAIELLQTMGCC